MLAPAALGKQGTDLPITSFVWRYRTTDCGASSGEKMAVPQTSGIFWFQPATKREADILALKVFCLGSFILLGLIIVGVL